MFEGLLQPLHLLLILVIARVVFGPKKLPEFGNGLGEAIRGFKKALDEEASNEIERPQISQKANDRKSHN